MKYLNFINEQIRSTIEKNDNLVLFGQNISAGSCLGGLTKNLKVNENSKIILISRILFASTIITLIIIIERGVFINLTYIHNTPLTYLMFRKIVFII